MSRVTGDTEFGSTTRQRIFTYAIFALAAVFIIRLGWLQIVEGGAYRLRAETQAIKKIKIEPYRGIMYDRYGKAIVQNVAGFTVTITPYEATEDAINRLSRILQVPDSLIHQEVDKARYRNRFNPFKLKYGRDIPTDVLATIEENREWLPGVDVIVDPKRYYAFNGNAAHLLGYTREVNDRQLQTLGESYGPGDITGQTGLEKAYERYVRGIPGYEFVAVNNRGQRVSSFRDGKNDVPSREGFDLFLGLDSELQSLGEEIMKKNNYRGGIVALDPNNGEILCFVSAPDYSLRQLTGRTTRAYFNEIFRNEDKPLFNRGSMPNYPPGSTWKMLVAMGCLEEGLITPTSRLTCVGAYYYGNTSMKCHGAHGAIPVDVAIQVSCNSFFAQCGMKLGPEGMKKWGAKMGFGQKTGVDITEEARGLVPSREYMDKRWGKRGWSKYAPVNWGIGQGEVLVTPLQMATYTAALANGGTLYQPHAARAMYDKMLGKMVYIPYDSTNLGFKKEHVEIVQKGMYKVVNVGGGTAGMARIDNTTVAGKTGTAENPHGRDHSWFVAYAPFEKPEIAICVMVENAGYGSEAAAPVAKKLIDYYINRRRPQGYASPADSTLSPEEEFKRQEEQNRPAPDSLKGPFVAVR